MGLRIFERNPPPFPCVIWRCEKCGALNCVIRCCLEFKCRRCGAKWNPNNQKKS